MCDKMATAKNDKNENNDNTKETEDGPADFEKAIDAAGFGCFNMILLFVSLPSIFASVFETSTVSYILPVAECDLKLTLVDKGTLNAAIYAGMITSAIAWGYLADTQGRKKILVFGYLADAVCVFGSALSQNFVMLVVFKFLGGFIISGPGAVLFTYATEVHGAKYRARVLMVLGMATSTASLVLPMLAWAIFPRNWDFELFNTLNVHSWQIFLAVCGLPSLTSSLIFSILPESPKFLMSQGRNGEALRSFQKIYAFNKRLPKDTFPIKELLEEVPNRSSNVNEAVFTIENKPVKPKFKREPRTFSQAFREGMQQMKPMFKRPLLGHSILCCTMQFCILLGLNTIRLWLPQLFASTAEYEALHADASDGSANMCSILEFNVNKTADAIVNSVDNCASPHEISIDLYTNNIIVALTGMLGYCFAGLIVKAMGAKNLLTFSVLMAGFLGLGLYWSASGLSTLIISSAFVTLSSISTSSLLGVVVALFPTSLRTLVVAISLMVGRLGALFGNMFFPVLVKIGCIPPFLMVGLVMLCGGALSCILPSPKKVVFT